MPRVLIIGTGIAGSSRLRLANADFEVEIITKQRPKDSSTNWAQGGIAAILDKTISKPSMAISRIRSMRAMVCARKTLFEWWSRRLESESEICSQSVLSLNEINPVSSTCSRRRSFIKTNPSRKMLQGEINGLITSAKAPENHHASKHACYRFDSTSTQVPEGICGVWALDQETKQVRTIQGDAVILATGGAGQLWEDNQSFISTGDGIAMAYRTGASIVNMAFVQFHPTALVVQGERPFLITEALRGEELFLSIVKAIRLGRLH